MLGRILRLTARGLGDFIVHPFAHLLTLTAVAMVAFLAGFVLLTLHNVNLQLLKTRGQVEFQLYWAEGAKQDTVRSEWKTIRDMQALKEFKTFTPGDALVELAETLGESGDFSWLRDQNPLPYSALAAFEVPPDKQEKGWAAELLTELKSLPGVEKVHYAPTQMDLAQSWVALTRTVAWPVVGFLALVAALVVGNTIKLSLMTRRDEVEILSLVGARPWYIRWPLLTGGFMQGLVGSGAGLGLLLLAQNTLKDALNVPPFFIEVSFLPPEQCAALAGGVILVSLAASWVAVR